jgi:hypothetical protein
VTNFDYPIRNVNLFLTTTIMTIEFGANMGKIHQICISTVTSFLLLLKVCQRKISIELGKFHPRHLSDNVFTTTISR